VDCKYTKFAKSAEKGLVDGTCAAQGYTVKTGTTTKSYPVVGDIVITTYDKGLNIAYPGKGVKLGAYPGYAGDLKVTGEVNAYLSQTGTAYVTYDLKGLEDACKTTPSGVGNACGIHIHEGKTCADASAVGGHYYDAGSISSDPWSPLSYNSRYGSARGSVKAAIGQGEDIAGRAMVVHDSTGARVACATLPSKVPTRPGQLLPYPGYAGDLDVTGYVRAYLSVTGSAYVTYDLKGLEDACKTTPKGVGNACGIHIHEGKSCDDASAVGGHYYDSASISSDPWAPLGYNSRSGSAHGSVKAAIGKGEDIAGRAMVVHDSTGGRVACALLPSKLAVVDESLMV
jgi:hypothetical protein